MQGKDLLGIGAIVVGGYFVLKQFFGIDILQQLGVGIATPGTASSPQATDPTVVAAATTRSLILDSMRAHGFDASKYHTVSEFNWYYAQARGIPGPSDLIAGDTGSTLYSFDEWWAAMVGAGFSGFGSIGYNAPMLNRHIVGDLSAWERMNKRYN